MAWKPVVFLLVRTALANLDPYVFGRLAAIDAADQDSCLLAASVASECVANPAFTRMPEASQACCACCVGRSNIASEFRSCASYLRTAAPRESALYTNNLALASACSSASTVCGGAVSATNTRSASAAPSSDPPACRSAQSIISSCSRAVPSFADLPGSAQASCACYNSIGGTFTTAFDRFAASCASYYRTASPADYTLVAPLATFCARRAPASESGPFVTPTGPTDLDEPTATPAPTRPPVFTGTETVTAPGPASTSTSSGQAGQPAGATGPVTWAAAFLSFVLSLFVFV